jgi:hypothetical protein
MEGIVVSLINLYPFPTGRRLYALELVYRRARELGVKVVAEHAQRGIAHDRTTLAMEAAGRPKQGASPAEPPMAEGEASMAPCGESSRQPSRQPSRQIDTQLHRAILGLDSYLDLQVRVFAADSVRGHAATTLRQVLLPMGAGAMLQLPVGEELVEVDALVDRLDFLPEAADAMAALPDIEPIVSRIQELAGQYRLSLDGHGRAIGPERLCEARIRGQRLLAETVALIVGHFAVNAPDDDEGRSYLLEPILRQNQALREARQQRRQPTDIDPRTGLEESPEMLDSTLDTPTLDLRRPAA